jgi:parallel beta-helix repeat protein
MTSKWIALPVALCFAGLTVFAQNTIHVPNDQPTIQAGINVANSGDTVQVAPGAYPENIDFQGKNITVVSLSGASVTTIYGSGVGSVVTFDDNSTTTAVLQGFTISGGACAFVNNKYLGGGIYVGVGETPTITNNTITNNHGCDGAGISTYRAGPVIQNNVITHNQQFNYSGGNGGGGIQILGAGAVTAQVIGNTITDNTHTSMGGGIGMNGGAAALIKNNFIARNTAYNSGGGIAMINGSNPLIVQNVIVDNVVTNPNGGGGGGVYWQIPANPAPVSLLNNTIVGNTASQGSALYANGFPPVALITNNIIVGSGAGGATYCGSLSGSIPTFNSNDAINTSGPAYAGSCTDQTGINRNISADPSFVNAGTGNYRLASGSQAIDAGTNGASNLPQTDYSGTPRILDGNNDCVSTVDMGAYEFAVSANATFSSSSLTFANQLLGTSSNSQLVNLSNTGTTCFQFSGLQVLGDFSQTNNCSLAGVPGGSSCSYSVAFTPTAVGSRSGALSVTGSDGVTTSSPSVSLIGTGVLPPAASLSPPQLTFGPQPIGTVSATQIVMLTNSGGTPLNITGVSAAGPFLQTNNCPASLAGGAACTISVTFASNTSGTRSGYVSITDNASGSPQSVTLTGTASDFAIAVTPNVVTVKHGETGQFLVTIPAVGGAFNSNVALSCSGLPNGATCSFSPATVTPGNSGSSSILLLSTNPPTNHATSLVNVIGQSGSLQHSAQMTLTVK